MNFEVLVATMHQSDFSKISEMNISSDVVFANQCDRTAYEELRFDGHTAKMISTETRGVGVNRNLAFDYASGDICLFADDDMRYDDGYESVILNEFAENPKADIIIFNIGTSTPEMGRMPTQIKKKKFMHTWSRNPYGAPRIALRRDAVLKSNIAFSTLFGGGCLFSNGEDSIWLRRMMSSGLKVMLSPKRIGDVSYAVSTCYSDDPREKLYTSGAITAASSPKLLIPAYLFLYAVLRKPVSVSRKEAVKLFCAGMRGYKDLRSYKAFLMKG